MDWKNDFPRRRVSVTAWTKMRAVRVEADLDERDSRMIDEKAKELGVSRSQLLRALIMARAAKGRAA